MNGRWRLCTGFRTDAVGGPAWAASFRHLILPEYVVTTIDKSCGGDMPIRVAQSHEHVALVASIHCMPLRKSATDKSIRL